MSTEQELTTYNTGINLPQSGGAYASMYDNDEEKADTIDDSYTNRGDDNYNIHDEHQNNSKNEVETERGCCCRCLIGYIRPISCDIGHSLCCIFYHVYNFFFALGIFIFDITTITTSIALCAVFCIGLLLLWLTYESIILLSRFDLAMAYYLVERDAKSMGQRKELLKLSVYMKGLPICCENSCCCCCNNDGCIAIISQRAKHLFYSCNMFCIIIYHIFIRGFITIFSFLAVIICGYFVSLIALPIWYGIDNSVLDGDKGPICPFGQKGNDCKFWKFNCDECYGLEINNIWKAVGCAIVALLFLPISFRISNFIAEIVKKSTYYFYTYYYSEDSPDIQDRKSLLNKPSKGNHHTNVVEIDEDFVNL